MHRLGLGCTRQRPDRHILVMTKESTTADKGQLAERPRDKPLMLAITIIATAA